MKYGILVPKLHNSSVLYKDINVYQISDNVVTKKYNYNDESIVSYNNDIEGVRSFHLDKVASGSPSMLTNDQKTMVTLNTEKEAYIQKLIFLGDILDIFEDIQKNDREDILRQIPENINNIIKKTKEKYPEVLL